MITLIGQAILFLLGMSLCVQWVAAFYGIIDLYHTVGNMHPQAIRRMLIWSALNAAIAWLLIGRMRTVFLWGMAVYLFFFFFTFCALKFLLKRNRRLLKGE